MAEINFTINSPEGLDGLKAVRKELTDLNEANNKATKDYLDTAKKTQAENDKIAKSLSDANKQLKEKSDYITKLESAMKSYGKNAVNASNAVNDSMKETADLMAKVKEWGERGIFNTSEIAQMNALLLDQGDAAENLKNVYDLVRAKLMEIGDTPSLFEIDKAFFEASSTAGTLDGAIQNVISSFGSMDGKSLFSVEELNILAPAIAAAATEADALKEIYDALSYKQSQFTEGSDEWNEYDAKIEEVAVALNALNGGLDETATKSENLKKQLKVVRDEMQLLANTGDTTSEAYRNLEERAGALQSSISLVDRDIRLSGSSTKGLDKTIGVLKEVTASFGLVQGAQALFGQESESVQKALLKVNALMVILSSLTELQTALTKKDSAARVIHTAVTNAFAWAQAGATAAVKLFRGALIATGLGAIVVLIGTLIAKWDELTESITGSTQATRDSATVQESANSTIAEAQVKYNILAQAVSKLKSEQDISNLTTKEAESITSIYNSTLGTVYGSVNNVTDAVAGFIKNGNSYIETIGKMARASAAMSLMVDNQKKILDNERKIRERDYSLGDHGSGLLATIMSGSMVNPQAILEEENKKLKESNDNLAKEHEVSAETITKNEDKKTNTVKGGVAARGKSMDGELNNIKKFNQDYINIIREYEKLAIESTDEAYDRDTALRIENYQNEKKDLEAHYLEIYNSKYISDTERLELTERYNLAAKGLDDKYFRESADASEKRRKELYQIKQKAQQAELELNEESLQIELLQLDNKFKQIAEDYEAAGKSTEGLIDLQMKEQLKIIATYNQKELDDKLATAKRAVEILNTQGLDEEAAKRVKANMLLELDRAHAKESLDILIYNIDKERKVTIEQLNKYREYVAKSLSNNESPIDLFSFLGLNDLDLSEDDKQRIIDYVDKIGQEVGKAANGYESDFSVGGIFTKFFDFGGDEGKKKASEAINQTASIVIDAYHSMMDAMEDAVNHEIDLIDKKLQKLKEQEDEQKAILDREAELKEQGFANNYELEEKKLEDIKRREEEQLAAKKAATEQLIKIQKRQAIADFAASSASLIASVANTIQGLSTIPVVGWALGLAAAGALVVGFVSLQSKLKSMNDSASFKKGGQADLMNMLSGQPSHEQGGVGLYNEKTKQKIGEFEGDEKLFVINKGDSQRYASLLGSINKNDKKGIYSFVEQMEGNKLSFDESSLDRHEKNMVFITKVEANSKAVQANFFDSPELKSIAKSNKAMLDLEKNKETVTDTNEYRITTKGNVTKKIKKR